MRHDARNVLSALSTTFPRAAVLLVLAALAACADQPGPLDPQAQSPAAPQQLRIPVTGTYLDVSAGHRHTCAVRSDGVVECWGDNFFEQAPASRTPGTGAFAAVDAFGYRSCALRSDGAIECWGQEPTGTTVPAAGTIFTAVATGAAHSCGLRSDGVAQCWGYDDDGQAPAQRTATTGDRFTALAAGSWNTCGLSSTGVIECWGRSSIGVPPYLASEAGPFRYVAVANALCGIRTDGVLECGPGGETLPTELGSPLLDVDLYDHYVCATRADGVVACRGTNTWGTEPAEWHATTGHFTQVTVGYEHWCALRNDGKIECGGEKRAGAFSMVAPTATFTAPASVIVGQPIALVLSNPQVPGYAAATDFTFAFDCGSGFETATTTATASCPTSTSGTVSVGGRVIDEDRDFATYSADVLVKTAAEGTVDLRTEITLASLSPDLRKPLMAKLTAALEAIAKGKTKPACSALADFINQVSAQRGKAIPADTADAWIETARQLQAAIGC